jgi:hypothetical protein
METMLGISLYSYPYLNLQKHSVFLIIASVFSSTKLPGSEGSGGKKWGLGSGGEMTQTMYAHKKS